VSATDLAGDTAAAIEFLHHWEPGGPWVLTAIVPDGPTETVTFHPGEEPELRRWIDRHQGKQNIYFSVNRVKHDVRKKTSKADIGLMLALHVDLDPSASADLVTEQQHMLEKLQMSAGWEWPFGSLGATCGACALPGVVPTSRLAFGEDRRPSTWLI
jgi:hypothetical protein